MTSIAKWVGIGGGIVTLALTGFALVPGEVERYNGNCVGHYVGLGWINDNSWFGFRYYRFEDRLADGGRCVIEYRGGRYNPFTRYFPDGTVSVTGTVLVDGSGIDVFPLFDEIETAICYRPDGSIASRIENGTGTWTSYFPDGTLHFRRTFEDYMLMSWQRFNSDGTIADEHHF